jgi:hypothetical protein
MRPLKRFGSLALGLATVLMASSIARADDVTDWNQHMLRAGTVGGTSPLVMSRVAAIVQASVFDAVNGIDRKYMPVHVPPGGDAGASRRAAVVEAAYTALVALYPTQKSTFDARLAVSLTAIASDPHETAVGIASGVAWGQTVANGILSWRANRRLHAGARTVRGWECGWRMAAHLAWPLTGCRSSVCVHDALVD